MVNTRLIVRHLAAPLSALALTWCVIQIPGEYIYASVWLMPTLAAFFACATSFFFMYRGMGQGITLVRQSSGSHPPGFGHLSMAGGFDAVGKVCIGSGVLSALIQTLSSPTHCSWEFPFAMGIGIVLGVKVSRQMVAQQVRLNMHESDLT
jgi:hypothetical protein